MNRVELVGRLTARPELSYTNSNKAYSRFNIAINRMKNNDGENIADFIPVVTWEKQAENVCNYLDKGSLVAIEGTIQTGTYEDKDGNRRSSFTVFAHRVEFLESKNAQKNENTVQNSDEEDPYAEYGESVTIDDNFLD